MLLSVVVKIFNNCSPKERLSFNSLDRWRSDACGNGNVC